MLPAICMMKWKTVGMKSYWMTEMKGRVLSLKDADLIGYPIRVTIGKKWKESGLVEVRLRRSGVVSEVALADCKTKVLEMLEELHKKNL